MKIECDINTITVVVIVCVAYLISILLRVGCQMKFE